MLKICVVGGGGYTGRCLVESLLRESPGAEISVVDACWFGSFPSRWKGCVEIYEGDIRTLDFHEIFDGVEVVVHLANIANDPAVDLNPSLSWEVNVLALQNMITAAIGCGVRQFVYASSGSVYGVSEQDRVDEDSALKPISTYNKTKMIAERVALSFAEEITISIVRPATVCGVSERMRLDVAVNALTYSALSTGEIVVDGGDQIRPNVHINDLIAFYQFVIGENLAGVFNCGFENMSILDIARLVKDELAEYSITITRSGANDPRSYRISSDKALASGFEPKFGVRDAISDIRSWYEDGGRGGDECHTVRRMLQLGIK